MARSLLFDATARDFSKQWQRLDWQLLQISPVHRYQDDSELERTATGLAGLGYLIHHFDASNWWHEEKMHAAFSVELEFPSYYGRNLDALNDVFKDVAEYRYGSDPSTTGTIFVLAGYEQVAVHNHELAYALLNIFAGGARHGLLVGHPMLCLISSMCDFPAVGATPIALSPEPP